MDFYTVEECFLCSAKGCLEVDQVDDLDRPDHIECPCCHGAGVLRVYGGKRPNN